MKKNYIYDFILPFFTSSDENRPVMQQAHKDADGYIYATDAHIMIRIPADKVSNEYEAIEKFPNAGEWVTKALNNPDNISRSIMVDDLIMILSKAKWYKAMKGDICPDCGGDGKIECNVCGYDHDCERCDGTGEVKKRVVEFALLKEEDNLIVEIEQKYFKASHLHVLAIAAKVAGVDTIEFISGGSDTYTSLFRFDDVVILVASTNPGNPTMVLKTKVCTK